MPELRAIETRYKGYRFRSRLEARWAVFFDALDITWEYEIEGFELDNGSRYLPDFWLPTFDGGIWAEVKPLGRTDWPKVEAFVRGSGQALWLCEGTPDFRVYTVVSWTETDGSMGLFLCPGIPNGSSAHDQDRMFVFPGFEEEDGSLDITNYGDCVGQRFINAVNTARGARFEHGEQPHVAIRG